jgi:hypothetical protein
LHTWSTIQSYEDDVRAYTPGKFARAHPVPKLKNNNYKFKKDGEMSKFLLSSIGVERERETDRAGEREREREREREKESGVAHLTIPT